MFDKDRFHNALALSLGYERIVKDKRITIDVDDSDDPWVTLKFQGCPEVIRFKTADINLEEILLQVIEYKSEIKKIIDAVHEAFKEATKPF